MRPKNCKKIVKIIKNKKSSKKLPRNCKIDCKNKSSKRLSKKLPNIFKTIEVSEIRKSTNYIISKYFSFFDSNLDSKNLHFPASNQVVAFT